MQAGRPPHLTALRFRSAVVRRPLLLADAVGLVRRRRAVAGRRLGQAAARRLAGERRVFFLRRPDRAELKMLLEPSSDGDIGGDDSSIERLGWPSGRLRRRPLPGRLYWLGSSGRSTSSASGLDSLRSASLRCLAPLDVGIVRPAGRLRGSACRSPAAADRGPAAAPAASARGSRCRCRRRGAGRAPAGSCCMNLASGDSSRRRPRRGRSRPAQPITTSARRARRPAPQRLWRRLALKFVMPVTRSAASPEPSP